MASTETDKNSASSGSRPTSLRQLVLFTGACLVIFGYLIMSLFFTLPSNPISSRHDKGVRPAVNILSPQNWAFFTRNPQTVQVGAYSLSAEGEVGNLLRTPQSDASNLFGVSRTQRAQGPELGFLNAAVLKWAQCAGESRACLETASNQPAQKVENHSPVPTVCGDAYITHERTVPWGYRNLVDYNKRVESVAHVDVKCDS